LAVTAATFRPVTNHRQAPASLVGPDPGVDYDVDEPDLAGYGVIGPHPDLDLGVDNAAHGNVEPGFSGCECFGSPR
jgi:hypothetical protein